MPMSTETWLEKIRADRPPMSAAQIAVLRPVLAPVIPHVRAAPTVEAGAAPAEPHAIPRKDSNDQP